MSNICAFCFFFEHGEEELVPPTSLMSTTISDSKINLSWVSPAESITGYKIERNSGSGWYTIVSDTGNTNTSYSDTGLIGGVQYTYRVLSIRNLEESEPSDTSSSTTIPYYYSFHFDGITNRVIDFGDPAALSSAINAAGIFSIRTGLRKLTNTTPANRVVFSKGMNTGAAREIELLFNTSNIPVFRASPNGSAVASATGNIALTGLDWANGYEILWVFNKNGSTNADKLKGYLNGVAMTLTFGGTFSTIFNGSETWKIGYQGTGTTFRQLNGYLNYFTITSDVITAPEALALWNSGQPLKSSNYIDNIIYNPDFNNAVLGETNWSIPDSSPSGITATTSLMGELDRPHQNFYNG